MTDGPTDHRGQSRRPEQDDPAQVLLFYYDYCPGVPFTVVRELDWTITEALLVESTVEVTPNAGNYDAYVAQFNVDGTSNYVLLFAPMNEGFPDAGYYTLCSDVTFFVAANGLIITSADKYRSQRGTADPHSTDASNTPRIRPEDKQ